ncbi:hypothetical protein N7452_005183 [Penicillium brevicompactum]|uniref:Uncharacterized protein n=1 Tax=Penicillium brevicompactum TaxID=5074 RepID=A0A9W9QJF0_PENBR|nr:hypothetical protein N7452_005183 [Penicillium brevicompactum]
MCDVPFFPIFPICFQCGTDQNPCHCKVVGPTLGILLASLYLLWMWLHQDRQGVCSAQFCLKTSVRPFTNKPQYAGVSRQTKRASQ